MNPLRRLASIAGWIFHRSRHEAGLDAELRHFLDEAAAAHMRDGVPADEARRRARLDLGGLEQAKERVRAYRHGGGLDALGRDVRYAGRLVAAQPGFSIVVVLTLALGIGANTAIFSLIDALLLRSLPVERPDQLVQVFQTVGGEESESLSYPAVRALDAGVDAFRGVAGFARFGFESGEPGALRSVRGDLVTGAFYETLGLRPEAGRLLARQDDEPGAPLVAVISDAFWTRAFGRRPDAVGSVLLLNGKSVRVVGVGPPGFEGATVGSPADVTVAAAALADLSPGFAPILGPGATFLRVLARPAPGVSRMAAVDRLNVAWRGLADGIAPADWTADRRQQTADARFRLGSGATGWSPLRVTYRRPLTILMVAVGLLLTIACANVASLLLARASARRREVAVRLALGAGRWRVIRQMLIESVLVSLIGAAAGVPVAWAADRALIALIGNGPSWIDVSPDWRVLAFATSVALVSGAAFGLIPALRATAFDPARELREDSRTSTSRSRLLPVLVIMQVALSLVLVAVAGLFVRTFDNLRRLNPGFAVAEALAVGLGSEAADAAIAERLADQVRALPGVRAAGVATYTPLDGSGWTEPIVPAGQPIPEDDTVRVVAAGPGYFDALGIRIMTGRGMTRDDRIGAPLVAVLNDAASAKFFPGANPIGQQLAGKISGAVEAFDIVGTVSSVVDDALREPPHPTVYIAYAQRAGKTPFALPPSLVVRVAGAVEPVRKAMQTVLQEAQPRRIVEVRTLRAQALGTIVRDEVMATLAGTFGLIALTLAALGLYGLLSYRVARRAREIGIRLALGAGGGGVVRLVVRDGARLVIGGVLLGLPAAWVASRAVETMLFGLSPADPVSAATTIAALALAAALATLVPARRAARLDPLTILRRD